MEKKELTDKEMGYIDGKLHEILTLNGPPSSDKVKVLLCGSEVDIGNAPDLDYLLFRLAQQTFGIKKPQEFNVTFVPWASYYPQNQNGNQEKFINYYKSLGINVTPLRFDSYFYMKELMKIKDQVNYLEKSKGKKEWSRHLFKVFARIFGQDSGSREAILDFDEKREDLTYKEKLKEINEDLRDYKFDGTNKFKENLIGHIWKELTEKGKDALDYVKEYLNNQIEIERGRVKEDFEINKEILQNTHLLYVGGGSPEELFEALHYICDPGEDLETHWDLIEKFIKLYAGYSAGEVVIGKHHIATYREAQVLNDPEFMNDYIKNPEKYSYSAHLKDLEVVLALKDMFKDEPILPVDIWAHGEKLREDYGENFVELLEKVQNESRSPIFVQVNESAIVVTEHDEKSYKLTPVPSFYGNFNKVFYYGLGQMDLKQEMYFAKKIPRIGDKVEYFIKPVAETSSPAQK